MHFLKFDLLHDFVLMFVVGIRRSPYPLTRDVVIASIKKNITYYSTSLIEKFGAATK